MVNGQTFDQHVVDSLTVKGTIKDPAGVPILGAIIQIQGTEKFTTTDFDGNYSIKVKQNDILIFSYTGYESMKATVRSQSKLDVVLSAGLSCNLYPPSVFRLIYSYGLNYQTNEITIQNEGDPLPVGLSFDASYGTNFDGNTNYSYALKRSIRIISDHYLNLRASVENQNFNSLQFHKYQLEPSTALKFLNFGSKYYRYPAAELILGYINYDGLTQNENMGIGLGLSRQIINGLVIESSYTYWQHFNEFIAQT